MNHSTAPLQFIWPNANVASSTNNSAFPSAGAKPIVASSNGVSPSAVVVGTATPSTPGDNFVNTAIFKFFLTYSRQNNQSKNQWDQSKSFVQNCLAMLHPHAMTSTPDQGQQNLKLLQQQQQQPEEGMEFNPGNSTVSTTESSTIPILTMNDLQLLPMNASSSLTSTSSSGRRKHRRNSFTAKPRVMKHAQVPNGLGVSVTEREKWNKAIHDAMKQNSSSSSSSSSSASSMHDTPVPVENNSSVEEENNYLNFSFEEEQNVEDDSLFWNQEDLDFFSSNQQQQH